MVDPLVADSAVGEVAELVDESDELTAVLTVGPALTDVVTVSRV